MPAAELKAGALVMRVRLTPRAAVDRVEGICEESLRVRVRALANEGAANAALIACLAAFLDLPKSALHLASGAKARMKTVVAEGDPARLQAALGRIEALEETAAG